MALGHWVIKGSALGPNMGGFVQRFIIVLTIIILSSNISYGEDKEKEIWQKEGGFSVLMEQYTATWCEICASVDSWMPDYTDANGDRVIRIAIHDTFDDPFGTPITDHRLERYNTSKVFPTFWFDGDILAGGAPDTTTLHRSLLSAENQRRGDTEINLLVSHLSGELNISASLSNFNSEVETKITIMILENSIKTPSNLNQNGLESHHDILFAYNEINLNNSVNWSYPQDSWNNIDIDNNSISSLYFIPSNKSLDNMKIIIIHETAVHDENYPNTLGATSLYLGSNFQSSKLNLSFPIASILLLSSLPIIIQFRK